MGTLPLCSSPKQQPNVNNYTQAAKQKLAAWKQCFQSNHDNIVNLTTEITQLSLSISNFNGNQEKKINEQLILSMLANIFKCQMQSSDYSFKRINKELQKFHKLQFNQCQISQGQFVAPGTKEFYKVNYWLLQRKTASSDDNGEYKILLAYGLGLTLCHDQHQIQQVRKLMRPMTFGIESQQLAKKITLGSSV